MRWPPAVKVDVVREATPSLNVPAPKLRPLSLKMTVSPSGVPARESTVAVNVTGLPTCDGLRLEAMATRDDAFPTHWLKGDEFPGA
jgi:hypothetical protein